MRGHGRPPMSRLNPDEITDRWSTVAVPSRSNYNRPAMRNVVNHNQSHPHEGEASGLNAIAEEEELDYYQLQAKLNPIDNRTGRRTRRRASPGPPVGRPSPSNLEELVRLAAVTPRRHGLDLISRVPIYFDTEALPVSEPEQPTLREIRIAEQVEEKLVKIPMLKQYLNVLQENEKSCRDVAFNPVYYLRYNPDETQSSINAMLNHIRCLNCSRLAHGQMFCCYNECHFVCVSCLNNVERKNNHLFALCEFCGVKQNFRPMVLPKYLDLITYSCEFENAGCLDKVLHSDYTLHVKTCINGWRCFQCSANVNPKEIGRHFNESVEGHSAICLLEPRYLGSQAQFDVRIPYNSEFAVGLIETEEFGSFLLYQLCIMDVCRMIWILVRLSGPEPENESLQVEIGLRASYFANGKTDTKICVWNPRIYTWNTRFVETIQEVIEHDPELESTAVFDIGKDEFNEPLQFRGRLCLNFSRDGHE